MIARCLIYLLVEALLTALVGVSVAAQAPPPAPRVFTLEQAVDYALANYPAMRAALSQVTGAHEGVSLARTSYLPQGNSLWQTNRATRNNIAGTLLPQGILPALSGPVAASTSGASVWGSAAGLLFSWEPFDFGARGALVNVARAGEATAQARAEVTRLDVAVATVNAYLSFLAARQVGQTAQADVDRRQILATSIGIRVQNQLRPGADASRVEADLALARNRLIQAQIAENVSRVAFATLLGLTVEQVEIVPGPLLSLPSAQSLPTRTPTNNPIARAQMLRIAESLARERVLAKSYFPRFNLQAAFSGRGSGLDSAGQVLGGSSGLGLQRANWAAGVQVTFSIFQIFSLRAARRIEQANEATEEARHDQILLDVSGQVAQAQVRLNGARQIAQNTPTEVAAARDAEQQARARYDAGLATLVEVSEAQSLLVQAEINDSLARLGIWGGLAQLAAAQGDIQPFLDILRAAGP